MAHLSKQICQVRNIKIEAELLHHLLAMGRKKKGKDGKPSKLGAPEHFTSFKLDFLAAHAEAYQQALDSKTTMAFYNKEEPFWKKFAEDPPNPEDSFEDKGIVLSKEEAAEHVVLITKLRTKLGQWYRCKYKRPEATKLTTLLENPFMSVLITSIQKAP
ncbi:hypothetical protein PILCRDRAFT_86557 [Piloderma croceum F 1598]|uniref:Uncharacterized protein n=1 Tax=Piloderma croceum (strain F 1598) TaxID=765440 RepID=A0A0C3G6R2_PILCF|nr:hypothetical protein PILCRDRAFT_86557 [Piloderma croceum F 1598]